MVVVDFKEVSVQLNARVAPTAPVPDELMCNPGASPAQSEKYVCACLRVSFGIDPDFIPYVKYWPVPQVMDVAALAMAAFAVPPGINSQVTPSITTDLVLGAAKTKAAVANTSAEKTNMLGIFGLV